MLGLGEVTRDDHVADCFLFLHFVMSMCEMADCSNMYKEKQEHILYCVLEFFGSCVVGCVPAKLGEREIE